MEQPQEVVEDEEHERAWDRVAAIDVAKASGVVCTRVPDDGRPGRRRARVWTVAATMGEVTALGDHLRCQGIEVVTIESTSDYWRIWHAVLEAAGLKVQLVNARAVKNVPGRAKTDKKDAVWLAKLTERGMLQPSFIPARDIRTLREFTRLRAGLVAERTRHWSRLEKLLERALIKVTSVASAVDTMSCRDMIEALIAGERNPRALADLARGKMRAKRKALTEALDGRFEDHHAVEARILLRHVDELTRDIEDLTARAGALIAQIPAAWGIDADGATGPAAGREPDAIALPAVARLDEITGCGPVAAMAVIAEIGLDMTVLLTETGHHRYGMHDLLRRYARELAAADPQEDHDRALGRLLDYYQHAAARADARLARQARPGPPPADPSGPPVGSGPDDEVQALAWARAERASLLACLDHAVAGQDARVVALTAGLAGIFRRDGPWAEAITRHTAAARAAQRLGDRPGEAGALIELGVVQQRTGEYPAAARDLEQALGIYRGLGDDPGQASALVELGVVRRTTGDYPAAARDLEQALGIYCGLGDPLGQAYALNELGNVRLLTLDYPAAVQEMEQALGIFRGLGDRLGQASALNDLGIARWMTGDYPAADRELEQALGIFCGLGDRLGEASALANLGTVRCVTGEYSAADRDFEQALGICRDLGYRHGQAGALTGLAAVRQLAGDYPAAAPILEQALGILRDLGNPPGQASALSDLGTVRRLTGDYPAAAQALEQALSIYRDFGNQGGEARVLNEKGALHRVSGEFEQAEKCHQQALGLARVTAGSSDEAHALAGLGRCAIAAGHTTRAATLLRQAHEIFQQASAAEAPVSPPRLTP